jgi:hypothetical protein
MEKSRGADDQVDQMSQALNRLRAIVSLPKYSPPMPRPRRATSDGWRDRVPTSQPFSRNGRVNRTWAFSSGSGTSRDRSPRRPFPGSFRRRQYYEVAT